MSNIEIQNLKIGEIYSGIQRNREVFTGKLIYIKNVIRYNGEKVKLIKLEDKRGNYWTFFDSETFFCLPEHAPRQILKTQEELAKEKSEYYSTYTG